MRETRESRGGGDLNGSAPTLKSKESNQMQILDLPIAFHVYVSGATNFALIEKMTFVLSRVPSLGDF